MKTKQEKISLTIETDLLTYEFVDRLSKQLHTIEQTISGIEEQTKRRLQDLKAWTVVDPTDWLEEIVDEVEEIEKLVKNVSPVIVEKLNRNQDEWKNEFTNTHTKIDKLVSTTETVMSLLMQVDEAFQNGQSQHVEQSKRQAEWTCQLEEMRQEIHQLELKVDAMNSKVDEVFQQLAVERKSEIKQIEEQIKGMEFGWKEELRQSLKEIMKEAMMEMAEKKNDQMIPKAQSANIEIKPEEERENESL